MKSKKLEGFSLSEKSLLWIHGGHPFLPPSSDIHDKQHQLLKFVELLWPRKIASNNQGLLFYIPFCRLFLEKLQRDS